MPPGRGSIFEVDTKGICLICLNPNSRNNSPKFFHNECETRQYSVTAFQMILRYLKVDPTKWTNSDNSTLNLGVALCHRCDSITNEFLDLFQEFERIRLQLDWRIWQLQDLMGMGGDDKDGQRVREFNRLMSSGVAGASVAECLRKETMEKVSLYVKCSPPRVPLTRLENRIDMNKKPLNKSASSSQVGEELQEMMDTPDEEAADSEVDSLDWTPDSDAESQEYCQDNISSNKKCKLEEPSITEPVLGSSPWKCIICGEGFPAKDNLEIHQLNKHVKSFIPSKGLKFLPSSISEQELGAALVEVVSKVKTGANVNECPFCGMGGFPGKFQFGTHLLLQHLPKIISKINSKDSVDTRKNSPVKTVSSGASKSGSPWKCEYCDRNFSGNYKLERHKMSIHPIPILIKKGLLPSSSEISENKLMSAFGDILKAIKQPFQCPLCKTNTCHANKYNLRVHFVRYHPHYLIKKLGLSSLVPVPGDGDEVPMKRKRKTKLRIRMTCNLCGKHFSEPYHLKIHRIRLHLTTVLKGSLPSSATEKDLKEAMQRITSRCKIVARNKNNGALYECILCKKRVWHDLRVHLPKCHLEQVVEEMKNRPKTKTETFASKVKLFKCALCDKGFCRKSRIRPHSLYYCPNRPNQVLDDDDDEFQENNSTGKGQSAETMGNPGSLHDYDAQSIKVEEYQLAALSNDKDNDEDDYDFFSSHDEAMYSIDPNASLNVKFETD